MRWAFMAPRITPPVVAFGVSLDFTNYDVWPPSVQIVHPFTGEPYKIEQIPTPFPRLVTNEANQPTYVTLAQAYEPGEVPFICLPGVREYHQHPLHTGDQWLLIRNTPAGTVSSVLEPLYEYGSSVLIAINYEVKLKFLGLQQKPPDK